MKLATLAVPFLAALMLVGATATPSAAQETAAHWEWSSLSAVKTDPWRFNVDLYGWLPSAPIDIETAQGNASLPEDLDTILKALKFAAMGEGEVHKGPFGAFVSPLFFKGEIDEGFTGPLGQPRKATIGETVWLVDYGLSYDFGTLRLGENPDSPTVTLQPFAGALFFHDKIDVDVDPGKFGRGLDLDTTIDFNTPIVGLNTLWHFTDRWSARLGGNIGGFGVDDVTQTYEVVGTVAYHFELGDQAGRVFAGYRYLYIHYDDGALDPRSRSRVRWSGLGSTSKPRFEPPHIVGQFGSEVKVFSGVRSCRQIPVCHVPPMVLSLGGCR